MAITNREALAAGQTLVARYKGNVHKVLVSEGENGSLSFELDGKTYKSLSSAGSAIMGGTACNGWRFFSFEGDEPPVREKKAKADKASRSKAKTIKNIKKLPNQRGAPEGQTRWFCSSCMKGFTADGDAEPAQCPEGHPAVVEDEFAAAAEN